MRLQCVAVVWLVAAAVLLAHAEDAEPAPVEPALELRKGENYFRLDGTPRLVLGRNPTAATSGDTIPLL